MRQKWIVSLQNFLQLPIVIRPHIFSTYSFSVKGSPHSHIQRYFYHKHDPQEGIQPSIFFVRITVIPVYYHYFIFCFEFYYPIIHIIVSSSFNFKYFSSVCVKPIQNVVTKTQTQTITSWRT